LMFLLPQEYQTWCIQLVTAVAVMMVTKYGRLDETWLLVSNFAWLLGYHYFRETNLSTLLFTYRYRSNIFITRVLSFSVSKTWLVRSLKALYAAHGVSVIENGARNWWCVRTLNYF
jgi:hypothetical protein